jgi:histidinol-phosphate aminotransferase
MTIRKLARPEIQALKPYAAATQVGETTRLNANEVPWPNSVDHFSRPLNRYPEVRSAALHAALAKRFGCDAQQLLATRGTSEAIDLLIRAFCRAGVDNIVTTTPTFSMYGHYAEIQGASVREVPTSRDENFAVDVNSILCACDESTRLIFICTPNNPTGTVFPHTALLELLKQRGERSLIVVDEAYIEFSDESSAAELIAANNNLVVLRTLSKASAFAGARCGAVIGPTDVIQMLDAIQAPYAFATPVVECVLEALQEQPLIAVDSGVRKIVDERERIMGALEQFEFVLKIWPSAANFFLIQLQNVERLLKQSRDDKVLLRYFGGEELADCVRITVGSPEENDRLLQTFFATKDQLS